MNFVGEGGRGWVVKLDNILSNFSLILLQFGQSEKFFFFEELNMNFFFFVLHCSAFFLGHGQYKISIDSFYII